VKNRLRGRVHHDLRRKVEIATGSTQVALIELHCRHALKFVRDLAETHSISEATTLYADMAGVPAMYKDTLYLFLLDRLAAEELPRAAGGAGTAAPGRGAMTPPDTRPAYPGASLRTAV